MITLENNLLSVSVNPLGAELHSVFSKEHRHEYLWQGHAEIWPRRAPHLFPFVGKLKDNRYIFSGKSYAVPQHGFARDLPFQLISSDTCRASFELCAGPETLRVFPFHFALQIHYGLFENRLETRYSVFNPSAEPLFFSLGAHPGFSCSINGTPRMDRFYLEFEKEESCPRYFVKEGLISPLTEKFSTFDKKFPLNDQHFLQDALVFKQLSSSFVFLRNEENSRSVKCEWGNDFGYFGIWSRKGCKDFVCLEPWAGIADGESSTGELENKEGIIRLPSHHSKEFLLEFTFF